MDALNTLSQDYQAPVFYGKVPLKTPKADALDYSPSWTTLSLIVTGVALLAISAISVALLCTPLPLTCPLMFGLIAGVALPLWPALGAECLAIHTYQSKITQREFNFAKSQNNDAVKLEYYGKAAAKGHEGAIQWEYERGMQLLKDASNEIDESLRGPKFNEGLKIFEKSACHSIGNDHAYHNVFRRYPRLKAVIQQQFNEAVADRKPFQESLERYWNLIVRDSSSYPYPTANYWLPTSFSNPPRI